MLEPKQVIARGLETAINSYLRLDPEAASKLARLATKVIHIELSDFDQHWYLSTAGHGVQISTQYTGKADISIRAPVFSLLQLARRQAPTPDTVIIEGDVHSAQILQQLIRELAIDWEEILARIMGDLPAHQIGNIVRSLTHWGQQRTLKLRNDISEYLLYERQVLPPAVAVKRFLAEVDTLRDDIDRLAARIQRLQQYRE